MLRPVGPFGYVRLGPAHPLATPPEDERSVVWT